MATLKEQDIVLHTTDSSGNPVIQLPVTRLGNVEGQDSKLVHTTGNETVAGTKTFSSSPIAPTPTAGDNSTKVATTAFVTTVGNAKAPTSHASTATIYGIGTGSNYGHVKLSDSTSSTSAASAGIAASPKAVKAAYDLANTAKTNAAMAQTTADACLPLSGGTVTGAVTIQHGYRGLVQKLPSDAIYTDHAFLDKYGNLYANIRMTKNDNGSSNISISANGKNANGSITWCSLEVGANSDGSSSFIKFNGDAVLTNKTGLPLTGGEMTGQIVFNKSECLLNTKESNQDMRIGGGGGYSTGTVLYMFGKDSTSGQGFYLRTVNKDNQAYQLSSDGYGSLTWNGNAILTTANGLALNGSNKMSGNLGFTASNHIFIDRTDGYMRICGGKVNDGITGGNITLFGGEHSTGWGAGAGGLQLEANNGTVAKALRLSTDGSLLWDGHTARHYLKHSTATNVAVNGTEVTIPYDGLLYVWLQRGNSGLGKVIVKINDYTMPTLFSNNYSWCTCPYPVEKGQVVTITQEGLSLCGAKLYAFK